MTGMETQELSGDKELNDGPGISRVEHGDEGESAVRRLQAY